MDFLDSLDLDVTYKKSHRVRSWYLYEQFKALERHQFDAAQKLKDKTYQDKILYQELSERRARRLLSDQCQSESGIERIRSQSRCINSSNGDFLECFCDVHDDDDIVSQGTGLDTGDMDDIISQDESQPDQQCEDYKSMEDSRGNRSDYDSVNSVVDNFKSNQNLADDIKEELEYVKKNIAENISLQLSTVKENIDCLEKFTAMCDDGKLSSKYDGDGSEYSVEYKTNACKKCGDHDSNLYLMWSKLVSFAYQVIQLNHGNCCYDYSSQFLTAVLACDVLRRGVTRMCDILQPYVCPIKFATDDDVSDTSTDSHKTHKHAKIKCICRKRSRKPFGNKYLPQCQCRKRITSVRTCVTEMPPNYSASRCCTKCNHSAGKYSCDNRLNEWKRRFASEPRPSFVRLSYKMQPSAISSSSAWQEVSQDKMSDDGCSRRVVNPMLKIGSYIDSLLKEVDDS